jgi:hypothetical protein
MTSCPAPVFMPDTGLTRGQVEQLWARDRAALVKCGVSLGALVTFYADLDRRLSAAE